MIRPDFGFRRACAAAAVAAMLVSIPVMSQAQDADPNQDLKDQKARLDAQAELVASRAALDRARIAALGLPSFEGTRTVNAGAGAIEASMLSTTAVRRAAEVIKARLAPQNPQPGDYSGNYILLAGDEELNFAQAGAILTQMDAIKTLFDQIPSPPAPAAGGIKALGATAIIGAITAAAGLLRSNVELTALKTDAISDEMMVTALASQLGARAIIPSAMIGIVEECSGGRQPPECMAPAPTAPAVASDPVDWARRGLLHRFNRLIDRRGDVKEARDRIPAENRTPAQQRYAAAADRALTRFDAFFTAVTTADEHGAVPIAQAARLDLLRHRAARVVRVFVGEHSGSLVKTTNLFTTLGADPLRVSGALVARYEVTDPGTGAMPAGGIITCQTALVTLRRVQQWDWRGAGGVRTAQCQEQ